MTRFRWPSAQETKWKCRRLMLTITWERLAKSRHLRTSMEVLASRTLRSSCRSTKRRQSHKLRKILEASPWSATMQQLSLMRLLTANCLSKTPIVTSCHKSPTKPARRSSSTTAYTPTCRLEETLVVHRSEATQARLLVRRVLTKHRVRRSVTRLLSSTPSNQSLALDKLALSTARRRSSQMTTIRCWTSSSSIKVVNTFQSTWTNSTQVVIWWQQVSASIPKSSWSRLKQASPLESRSFLLISHSTGRLIRSRSLRLWPSRSKKIRHLIMQSQCQVLRTKTPKGLTTMRFRRNVSRLPILLQASLSSISTNKRRLLRAMRRLSCSLVSALWIKSSLETRPRMPVTSSQPQSWPGRCSTAQQMLPWRSWVRSELSRLKCRLWIERGTRLSSRPRKTRPFQLRLRPRVVARSPSFRRSMDNFRPRTRIAIRTSLNSSAKLPWWSKVQKHLGLLSKYRSRVKWRNKTPNRVLFSRTALTSP